MDYSARLQQAAKKNEEAKLQKARLEQKLIEREAEASKIIEELKANNVTKDTLAQSIETLSIDIENTLEAIEEA